MTTTSLPAALRAGAEGLYALEAATGLIIAHGTWLAREDFTRFIHHGSGTVAIDWEAATSAMDSGELPVQAGKGGFSDSPPASAATSRSASARPSPASTTATLACWSSPSFTPPADGSSPL
jgi:hypothetical protein